MTKYSKRRGFIKSTLGLLLIRLIGSSFDYRKKLPLLSFSTLGCPDWTFTEILDFAVKNNFQGIELRGIQRQLDLTKCIEFSSEENIHSTIKILKDKKLKIVDLGSSAALHYDNLIDRVRNLDEAKRYVDLANKIGCPYIRVFPDIFPKGKNKIAILDLIVNGLVDLGDYAKDSNVTVLMETHGDVVNVADLKTIMELTNHKNVGLIWDIVNMWEVTKVKPSEVYFELKKYIHHVHIKDAVMVNGKLAYTLLGKGETPILEAIDILRNDNYKGYYSFEWEKLWHPEIAEPAIALSDFSKVMNTIFN